MRGQGRGVPCEPVRETNSMSVTRRHQCSVPHAQTHKSNGRGESGTGQVGGLRVNREGTEPHRCGRAFTVQRTAYTGPDQNSWWIRGVSGQEGSKRTCERNKILSVTKRY